MSVRERLGWNPFFGAQAASVDERGLSFSRIVEEQRGRYRVAGDADGWAEVSGRFRHEAASAADFPAVGDWVGVVVSGEHVGRRAADRAIIRVRLERRSTVSRAAR